MIRLADVYFSYQDGVAALKGVSLNITEGEVVAIMGENGAGKTTLLKHLNGLLKPQSGLVLIDSKDTRNSSVAELSRSVGLVFQSPDSMFFANNVEEEVAFALRNFGYGPEEVEERTRWALGLMGLQRYSKRSPFALSGGEKKRLAIAVVLAWGPKYIAIDEPTVGQDAYNKRLLKEAIENLAIEGRSVIISTHDVEFVADLRPRVVLMSSGRVIADGPAKDVLTDEEVMSRCSLLLPQVAALMRDLEGIGVRTDCLTSEEAAEELARILDSSTEGNG